MERSHHGDVDAHVRRPYVLGPGPAGHPVPGIRRDLHRLHVARVVGDLVVDLQDADLLVVGNRGIGEYPECGFGNARIAGGDIERIASSLDQLHTDPAAVAAQFIGTPYLWGGRTAQGLDCSALVQLAFGACGVLCPRDSDMQQAWFGERIDAWQTPGALQRGDLIFWKGHVGLMADSETLLHANGTFMTTMTEPLLPAIERIANEYGEPLEARRVDVSRLRGVQPAWLTLPSQ